MNTSPLIPASVVLDIVDAAVLVADGDGVIRYANRAARDLCPKCADSTCAHMLWEVIAADSNEDAENAVQSILGGGSATRRELTWRLEDGSSRRLNWHLERIESPESARSIVVATGLDVTDLRESEEQFRWLSSATIEGITAHERGVVFAVNQRCADMFGYTAEEMIGRPVLDFATAPSGPVIMKRIEESLEGPYEVVGLRKDGSTFPLEIVTRTTVFKGRHMRIAGLRDVSQRKRLEAERHDAEERLHRAQRLETVALLAGGIAHDFNNLLMVILNYSSFALDDPGISSEGKADIRQVMDSAEAAARLTSQLLIFSKHQEVERGPSQASRVIASIEGRLRSALPTGVELDICLDDDLWEAQLET